MVEYCKSQDIEMAFFIPPTHQQLQDKLNHYGLQEQNVIYKTELSRLGTVVDYDLSGPLTSDKS